MDFKQILEVLETLPAEGLISADPVVLQEEVKLMNASPRVQKLLAPVSILSLIMPPEVLAESGFHLGLIVGAKIGLKIAETNQLETLFTKE